MTWNDLNVTPGIRYSHRDEKGIVYQEWTSSEGERRIQVSLKGASFVSHTFWIKGFNVNSGVTRAVILLIMQKELSRKLKALNKFIPCPPTPTP